MPRPAKGPRLWLRPERRDLLGRLTHEATWLILDGRKQITTGYGRTERIGAESALLAYCEATQTEREIAKQFPELYLYFITANVVEFPIKIGISESPRLRMTSLQTGLPYELNVLAIVSVPDTLFERRLHKKFASIRLRGEWFKRTPELLLYIEELSKSANVTAKTN